MADGIVAPFPAAAPEGVRTAVELVITVKQNLENAEVALGRLRIQKLAAATMAFLAASKTTVSPENALKAQLAFDATEESFDAQLSAIQFWEQQVDKRLDQLADESGPEVIDALTAHLAALKEQLSREQCDVDHVNNLIAEFEKRIAYFEKSPRQSTGGSAAGRRRGPAASKSRGSLSGDKGATGDK